MMDESSNFMTGRETCLSTDIIQSFCRGSYSVTQYFVRDEENVL